MLNSAQLAIDAVERYHRATNAGSTVSQDQPPEFIAMIRELVTAELCPTCKGSGKVEPSELFSLMAGIAYGSSPKLVMCLDCFGEGVKQP